MADPGSKRRVAVLGGGTAALAAACELTATAELREQVEVTVYQVGWRLGGKGASTRNPDAAMRIEEHGLHVWGGFYENAFASLRACYAERCERGLGSPLSIEEVFQPQDHVSWMEEIDGVRLPWTARLARNDAAPGSGKRVPSPWEYLLLLVPWMVRFFGASRQAIEGTERPAPPLRVSRWVRVLIRAATSGPDDLGQRWVSEFGGSASLADRGEEGGLDPLRAASLLVSSLPRRVGRHTAALQAATVGLLDDFLDWLWETVGPRLGRDHDLRRIAIVLDLACAYVRGMIKDGVIYDGFAAIDDQDYRAWLERHGARAETLQSAAVRGIYDYVFAYESGQADRPSIAAGVALRLILRLLLTYKGALFYEMRVGMGEAVFAPIYQVLAARGVRFRFFHAVRDLELSADGQQVESIVVGRQLDLAPGRSDYQPLAELDGLAYWPNQPDRAQLAQVDGLDGVDLEDPDSPWPDRERLHLKRGQDFDTVVLGVALAALEPLASDLRRHHPRWARMLDGLGSSPTLSAQLWLKPDAAALGWEGPRTVLTANAPHLDTWGDLSHLVDAERWPEEHRPGNIAYLVGSLPELDGPESDDEASARAKRLLATWLRRDGHTLFPTFAPPDGPVDWSMLVDLQDRTGRARLDGQLFRANRRRTDRYVLSLPGTTRLRLRADDSGVENLFLAGDWVRSGLDVGCIEAAVMAGRQAARGITGCPLEVVGEHDVEPRD